MKLILMILSTSALMAYGQDYTFNNLAGLPLSAGNADGTGTVARFNLPTDAAVDSAGNVFVVDYQNSTIRKITPVGEVTTIAGLSGQSGSANGTGTNARFNGPVSVAVATNGILYVSDRGNKTIRKITPSGTNWVVTTLAGQAGVTGTNDGLTGSARFVYTHGIAVDKAGNVYVADRGGHTIRKIGLDQTFSTVVSTIAGTPLKPENPGVDGTNGAARFGNDGPTGMTVDSAGNLYTTDLNNHTVRKIAPDGTNWVVTTIAGFTITNLQGNPVPGYADGIGTNAQFNSPYNLTVDSAGKLYVVDTYNYVIRKITPDGTNWVVTTIAGTCCAADHTDGTAGQAGFDLPFGITVDSARNLYVADYQNHRITKGTLPPVFQITSIKFIGGNVQIDFSSAPADTPDMFALQSSGIVDGTYADVTPPANITQPGPAGSFRAVVAPSGGTQFYRLRK